MSREQAAGTAALRWALANPDPGRTLYDGSAGLLVALAEAHLCDVPSFARSAHEIRDDLVSWVDTCPGVAGDAAEGSHADGSLYNGLAGTATSLQVWAAATGDDLAAAAAQRALAILGQAAVDPSRPPRLDDLLTGTAGWLLALLRATPLPLDGIARLSDRLVSAAIPAGDGYDWRMGQGVPSVFTGYSHGAAGICAALAQAAAPLNRPELLDLARAGAARLLAIGRQTDGSVVLPRLLNESPAAGPSFGWCHGPTGTLRLFRLLDRLDPGGGWADAVDGCRRAVRSSGLPTRRWPGFWDNVGQCCGTAGVGEMALDAYQETEDPQWLSWSVELADDVLALSRSDSDGRYWQNVEHTRTPAELPPRSGWAMGASGVGSWLLRLDRVRRTGPLATALVRADGLPPR